MRCVTERLGRGAALVAVVGVLGLAVPGCEREGPAERTGKDLDRATKQAGENLEKAGKDVQKAAQPKPATPG
jgi:hypothetical protein